MLCLLELLPGNGDVFRGCYHIFVGSPEIQQKLSLELIDVFLGGFDIVFG